MQIVSRFPATDQTGMRIDVYVWRLHDEHSEPSLETEDGHPVIRIEHRVYRVMRNTEGVVAVSLDPGAF